MSRMMWDDSMSTFKNLNVAAEEPVSEAAEPIQESNTEEKAVQEVVSPVTDIHKEDRAARLREAVLWSEILGEPTAKKRQRKRQYLFTGSGRSRTDPMKNSLADLPLIRNNLSPGGSGCLLHPIIGLLISFTAPLLTMQIYCFLNPGFRRLPLSQIQIQAAPDQNSLCLQHFLLIIPGSFPAHQYGYICFHILLFF